MVNLRPYEWTTNYGPELTSQSFEEWAEKHKIRQVTFRIEKWNTFVLDLVLIIWLICFEILLLNSIAFTAPLDWNAFVLTVAELSAFIRSAEKLLE